MASVANAGIPAAAAPSPYALHAPAATADSDEEDLYGNIDAGPLLPSDPPALVGTTSATAPSSSAPRAAAATAAAAVEADEEALRAAIGEAPTEEVRTLLQQA